MDTYTITAASKLLGVSRQTIYKYINKEPNRFTALTPSGQQHITLQGLGILREELDKNSMSTRNTDNAPTTNSLRMNAAQGEALDARRERVIELESTVKVLQVQLDGANALISSLQAQNATLERALTYAQELHLQSQKLITGPSGGFWVRLFHRRDKPVNGSI